MNALTIVFLVIEGAAAALLIAMVVGVLRELWREPEPEMPPMNEYRVAFPWSQPRTILAHGYYIQQNASGAGSTLHFVAHRPGSCDKHGNWDDNRIISFASGAWDSVEVVE